MSALGHKQTSSHVRVKSVIPLKADEDRDDCGHTSFALKRGRQSCTLIWRGALFFALMLAHQFFDFDSAFAHR